MISRIKKNKRILARLQLMNYWLQAQLVKVLYATLQLIPADASIGLMARIFRKIGPHTRRHKLMIHNLKSAYPDKAQSEIDCIALDAWGALGRMLTEHIYIDKLYDFDSDAKSEGRVEIEGLDVLRDLVENPRPFIVFTAHTGNFEMLSVAAASMGINLASMFRPSNNPYLDEKINETRDGKLGKLVASRGGASFALVRHIEAGGGLGFLVDQKFASGAETTFFGLPVRTNTLLPRLAKRFDCEVFAARCVRLPENRFRIIVEPAVEQPRDEAGEIDVRAFCQLMNDKVEAWVREEPGQWLWYHDRWDIKRKLDL